MFINFLIALVITWLVGWGVFPPCGDIIHLLLAISAASFILPRSTSPPNVPLKVSPFQRSLRNGIIP